MKFFHVHPDDARWLRRFLRNNLIGCLAIVCFLLVIRNNSIVTSQPADVVRASESGAKPNHAFVRAIAPQGWRRTSNGWEHVSTWRSPQPLAEIISLQRQREPRWLQATLGGVRDLPPLIFAMFQIAAIAIIVMIAEQRRANVKSTIVNSRIDPALAQRRAVR